MADNPVTTTERERVNSTISSDTEPYNATPNDKGVHVYDRPAATSSPTSNPVATIITVLVLLILAYVVYQWLF